MFPLQRGNELVIQFSRSPHTQNQESNKISEDPILQDDYSSPRFSNNNSDKIIGNNSSTIGNNNTLYRASSSNNETKKKKMIHREIERQRRQDMAALYASLRSLLPLEYIKGKRSMSDHMNEAVSYIKHLQKNIQELGAKRDELKKHSDDNYSNSLETPHHDESQLQKSISFSLHENNVVGIEIISNLKEERFLLSKLLQLLLEQGLEVVACLSTQVNGRLLHSLNCQVNSSNSVDLPELRRKIASSIS